MCIEWRPRIHGGGRRRWFNLTIENVRPSGSGGYTCVAQNEGGMAEGNVTVVYSETVEHYRKVIQYSAVALTPSGIGKSVARTEYHAIC